METNPCSSRAPVQLFLRLLPSAKVSYCTQAHPSPLARRFSGLCVIPAWRHACRNRNERIGLPYSLESAAADADASAFRDFKIHGWKVLDKSARITAFKQRDYFQAAEGGNGSLTAGEDRLQPGVIFTIEIQRSTT